MNIEIVTVGDELVLGFTADANAPYLARELAAVGVAVTRHTSCPDDAAVIADVVGTALDRTGAVITTGGLGPTADDMTKPAIAAIFGRPMVRDESVVERLEATWRARGRSMPLPESNYAQAMVPEGAELLPNHHGTAPGILLADPAGPWVAMLPGVPREMREMFRDALLPRIRTMSASSDHVIRSATLRTSGVPESALADRLAALELPSNTSLAYLPGVDGVDLRVTARGMPPAEADAALGRAISALRERVREWAYGDGDTDLAAVVLDACRARALRVAVAESCTGGLLGARITRVPGASDTFHGGLIAYDNRVKRQLLGVLDPDIVEHGAVSEPVALQMAKGIRVRLGTEIGIGITGVAGPGGGSPEKPVGTVWIALDVAEGRPPQPRPAGQDELVPFREARVFQFPGNRDEIRERAAQAGLDMLRRALDARLPVTER